VVVLQCGDFAGGQHLIKAKQNVIKHYTGPRTWIDVWHNQSNGQYRYRWENTSMFGSHKRRRNSSVTEWIVASKLRFFLHVLKFPGDLIQWNLLRGQLCQVVQINWPFKGQPCLHHQCSDLTQHVGYLDYMYNCTTLELVVECQGIGFMSTAWYCCAWLLSPLDNSLICLSKLFTGRQTWLNNKLSFLLTLLRWKIISIAFCTQWSM
jgi:hypothetical protein